MKTFRTTEGPFQERPHFTDAEIEEMCITELRSVRLFPEKPQPIRIEKFIEGRFGITPSYSETLPNGVLGFTRFGADGPREMVVSRDLAEDGALVSQRRVNTTLAHEAGHCLLHAYLFALSNPETSLFTDELNSDPTKILCRESAVSQDSVSSRKYHGPWWEVQANMVIGPLLLPKSLVLMCLEPQLVTTGGMGTKSLPKSSWEEAVRYLANTFDVNPVVARIRLDRIFPETGNRQLTL